MDFSFTPEQKLLRDSVREIMKRNATPEILRKHDQERTFPYDIYAALADAGLLSLAFPEEYDGLGGTAVDMVMVAEEISRVSTDVEMAFGGAIFCGLNILHNGSEEQKRYWLPKVMEGQVKLAITMSEPDAGSDVGSMRSTARHEGDRWILNGQKVWISGGGLNDSVFCAYVRTHPTAHYREAISLFLVDNTTPGVEFRKLDMLGHRSFGTYEVFFKDVEVPEDRLVGGENKGWGCMLSGLKFERAMDAAMNVGACQAIVDLAAQYAQERCQFGKPIGSFQAIGHMIADMQTEVEAGRALVWRAAWLVGSEDQMEALRVINMAKLFTAELHAKLANMGVQIMGAIGLSAECEMQRYFRDSRSATIQAGTSQTQRTLIAGLMGLKAR